MPGVHPIQMTRGSALALLLFATGTTRAADDFWTLHEKGEMNGKPEVAYAHFLASLETMEPTVFCRVGAYPCGDAGERDATAEQVAEIREAIAAMRGQVFFSDVKFRNAQREGNRATLKFAAKGDDGESVAGTVVMDKGGGDYWRIVEQRWDPPPRR